MAGLEEGPFVALNTGLAQGGAAVIVPPGVAMTEPIHLLVLSGEGRAASYVRNVIVVEEGASASVVETWGGAPGEAFASIVTEASLAEGASLTHVTRCLSVGERAGADRAHRIGSLHVGQAAKSRLDARTFWLGGRFSRHDLRVALAGEGAEAHLCGLYVLGDEQHHDSHTVIDHLVPRCTSRQRYKGVLGGKAHGVFNGKVFFRPGAEKSDTEQENHNLLLTDGAEIDSKPQLEIFADDVKASHGSTVGQLDDEAVFYLRSRGVPAAAARRMLTFAFVEELFAGLHAEMREGSPVDPLRAALQPHLDAAMALALAGTAEGEQA